jgi:hypothetical protein
VDERRGARVEELRGGIVEKLCVAAKELAELEIEVLTAEDEKLLLVEVELVTALDVVTGIVD